MCWACSDDGGDKGSRENYGRKSLGKRSHIKRWVDNIKKNLRMGGRCNLHRLNTGGIWYEPRLRSDSRIVDLVQKDMQSLFTARLAFDSSITFTLLLFYLIYLHTYLFMYVSVCLWLYSSLLDLGLFFSFLILYPVGGAWIALSA
jgi:hypothetical protein